MPTARPFLTARRIGDVLIVSALLWLLLINGAIALFADKLAAPSWSVPCLGLGS